VVVIEGAYETRERRIPVSLLLLFTPHRESSCVPIFTTNPLRRDLERTARDLATDIGVSLRRIVSEC
jgi:hypothetical protein